MPTNFGSNDFSSQVIAAFEVDVQVRLMGEVPHAPAQVASLIAELRERLNRIESLIPGNYAGRQSSRPTAATLAADVPATAETDEIGRNQRSRVRELVLLEALEAEHHALSLPQLTRALTEAGFEDTSAAIVSQLHRLKKLGVVSQPANGMYMLTQDGVLHVRELRRNFGHMKPR